MDLNTAKSVLAIIREEALRRDDVERDPTWAYEQGLADEAFVGEFCLIFLVALRHHLDRQLVNMAARANHGGAEITPEQFERDIVRLNPNRRTDWSEVNRLLGIDEQNRPSLIAALRLLANDYKHHPHTMPGNALIKHLNLTA